MARTRRRRSRLWGWLVVLLVLAGLVAAAEFGARALVAGRIADFVESEWGGTADVSLGTSPILLSLPSRELATVEIDARNLSYRSMAGASAQAELENARWHGGNEISASRSHMEIHVPAEGLEDAIVAAIPVELGGVTIVPRPESEQLVVGVEPGGVATILVTPGLDGDSVVARVDQVDLGAQVPGLDTSTVEGSYQVADLSSLPLELRPTELTVTTVGITIVLRSPNT